MQSSLLKKSLVSLALASLARADYYIDDQNSTSLVYSGNTGSAQWVSFQESGEALSLVLANGTTMTVDASQCFNYTYTYAACTLADNCQVQIPFSGSGITIYVLQAGPQGINATLTIDDGMPQYNTLPAPPGPDYYIPNVTLFSIQGIPTEDHTATMVVQSWENAFSRMMFDYAAINQTIISPTTTSNSLAPCIEASNTSIPTTKSTLSSSSNSTITHIGAIVGGVVGGLIAFTVLLLVIFCLRRRGHHKDQKATVNLDAEPRLGPFSAQQSYYSGPGQYNNVPHPSTTESMSGTIISTRPARRTNPSLLREKSRLRIANPSPSQIAIANINSYTRTGSSGIYSSDTSRPWVQQERPMLSADQADFVNKLYANNVPAAAIARVIERMIAGGPPPSYYNVSGGA